MSAKKSKLLKRDVAGTSPATGGGSTSAPTKVVASSSSSRNDGPGRSVLVDIYNKIAQFEEEKSDVDYLHAVTIELEKPIRAQTVQDAIVTFESNFNISRFEDDLSEMRDKMRDFFVHSVACVQENERGMAMLVTEYKTLSRKENNLSADKLRLQQALDLNSEMSNQLQEKCRASQKRYKETAEELVKMHEDESKKTAELKMSCQGSIDDVIISLEKEEQSLQKKAEENSELRGKIDSFMAHLRLRDQHLEAKQRAHELQQQIIVAKRAQKDNHGEQCRLKAESFRSRIDAQKDKTTKLREQIELYRARFVEFEQSLEDTKEVFKNFEDRGTEMASKSHQLEQKNRKVLAKAEVKRKELELQRELKAHYDLEYLDLEKQCKDADLVCRQLSVARSKILKDLQDFKCQQELQQEPRQVGGSRVAFQCGDDDSDCLDDPKIYRATARPSVSPSVAHSSTNSVSAAAQLVSGSVDGHYVAQAKSPIPSPSSSSSSSSSKRGTFAAGSPGDDRGCWTNEGCLRGSSILESDSH